MTEKQRQQYEREAERSKRHGEPPRKLRDATYALERVLKKTAVLARCERTLDVQQMESRMRRIIAQLNREYRRADRLYYPTCYRK